MKQLLRALHDSRIYLLIVPATIALWFLDSVIAETWTQWGLVLPILCGFALAVRKVLFNTFDMSAAIDKACETPEGSARVVQGVAIVMAAFLIAAAVWFRH